MGADVHKVSSLMSVAAENAPRAHRPTVAAAPSMYTDIADPVISVGTAQSLVNVAENENAPPEHISKAALGVPALHTGV